MRPEVCSGTLRSPSMCSAPVHAGALPSSGYEVSPPHALSHADEQVRAPELSASGLRSHGRSSRRVWRRLPRPRELSGSGDVALTGRFRFPRYSWKERPELGHPVALSRSLPQLSSSDIWPIFIRIRNRTRHAAGRFLRCESESRLGFGDNQPAPGIHILKGESVLVLVVGRVLRALRRILG